ncbi:MAG: hypothetical protein KY443_12135, partial [Actinobacteria bacterium]|nr:hypothetical protein [Actinomycetota bacterium]
CYGGGFTEALAPGRVLTGAAGANERAYENSGFGRSYMVEYMIRQGIIEGRAPDSVQSAFAYARDQLRRDFPDRLPVQIDKGSGPLDLRPPGAPPVNAQPRATTTTTTAPPAEQPPSGGGGNNGGNNGGGGTSSPPPKRCDTINTLLGC